MIQQSFMSSELARLRGLELLDEAQRNRLVRAVTVPRRAARRKAFMTWARRVFVPARPDVVIPAPRAAETGGRPQRRAPHPAVRAEECCH